jgi:hypothetical protein
MNPYVLARTDRPRVAGHAEDRLIEGIMTMKSTQLIALVLIVAGALGLAYGSFTYTKETHETKIGPIELSVKDKETVNIPVWAGVASLVGGILLLTLRSKA